MSISTTDTSLISLAIENKSMIATDDLALRKVAKKRDIVVVGTLGEVKIMSNQNETPQLPNIEIEIINIHGTGKCSSGFKIGDIFQYPKDRDKMCPSALAVLRPYLLILAYGGKIVYNPDEPYTFSISCPDAPVSI